MNAYNKKDAATIANMYTNDGTFSNPGWTASGRTAIEDALNKEFALGIFKYTSITVDQAQRIGDMTYSRGTDDDERLSPIGLHDQHVAIVEPAIQFPKAVRPAFDFDSPIDTEHRHAEIGTGLVHAGDLLGSNALVLQKADNCPLRPGALVSR